MLVSAVLITLDGTTRLLEPVRATIGTLVSPLQVMAEVPYLLADEVGDVASTHESLRARNAELERRILELTQISQQYLSLRTENERLRALLGSRARLPAEVMVAELVAVVPTPNTHQVIIDKGADSGVTLGQAVLDAQGLFGQVVEVDRFTSRVLLIVDESHAVPVQVNRSGVRSVAAGTGRAGPPGPRERSGDGRHSGRRPDGKLRARGTLSAGLSGRRGHVRAHQRHEPLRRRCRYGRWPHWIAPGTCWSCSTARCRRTSFSCRRVTTTRGTWLSPVDEASAVGRAEGA